MMIKNRIKSDSACRIEWDQTDPAQWDLLLSQVARSNFLQSRGYAKVMARLNHQRYHCGVIYINGTAAGLVLILEAGILRGAVQGVIADRAPLWFDGFGCVEDFESFLSAFLRDYPKRFGRKIRIIPEVPAEPAYKNIMEKYSFFEQGSPYQTAWLDLRTSEAELRAGLHSNWRNKLKRAEKAGLDIVFGYEGQHYQWILEQYVQDKTQRGYQGVSAQVLTALVAEFLVGKNVICATALLEGKPIAAIVVFIHGKSATYQVGVTSEEGRSRCAHHLLLWRVMTALKERAVYGFDLGGVNREQNEGVLQFKKATGAKIIETCGLYC